ncbi:asparaginase [soil metagenome]
MTGEPRVEVQRGRVTESRHRVHVAVVDAGNRLRAYAGDPDWITFFRSSAKPLQAVPLVDDGATDRFGFTRAELALCCGSHAGQACHVTTARSILHKAGGGAELLACGARAPFDRATRQELAEAGLEPGPLHHNCSDKHAGMIALARARGWTPSGYHRPEHPVQGRMRTEVAHWVGMPEEALVLGRDGCGVVCFGLPVRNMALGFARLAAAARARKRGPEEVVTAMTEHPEMIAGEGRFCTSLIRQAAGRLFAKIGAEGVYCVGVSGAELGIALKVEDGALRAVAPAILSVLGQLELISDDDFGALHTHAFPELRNSRGEHTGQLVARIALQAA